ncbi:hypothetical protein Bhyg_01842 [Pseudolycoriella hygida]|uniref:Uncharacterized protein n=1 Tax=Pseudolycoriella hygida TaxID=35572 RepID=A0A9Q0S658_9DIPT|nr:hypothetical protein Bhyg_01842 [Pseudolycoriella hygida]
MVERSQDERGRAEGCDIILLKEAGIRLQNEMATEDTACNTEKSEKGNFFSERVGFEKKVNMRISFKEVEYLVGRADVPGVDIKATRKTWLLDKELKMTCTWNDKALQFIFT